MTTASIHDDGWIFSRVEILTLLANSTAVEYWRTRLLLASVEDPDISLMRQWFALDVAEMTDGPG